VKSVADQEIGSGQAPVSARRKGGGDNLTVPPYEFLSDTKLVIGEEDTKGA
jgi:hypothetical protein